MFRFDDAYTMFDVTPVDNQFILEYLPAARGDFVKVYLYGLMHCYHPQRDMTMERMAQELDMTEEEILFAYRHWEQFGLVQRTGDHPPAFRYVNLKELTLSNREVTVDMGWVAFKNAVAEAHGYDEKLEKKVFNCYEWIAEMHLTDAMMLQLVNHMVTTHGKRFRIKDARALCEQVAESKPRTAQDVEEILQRDTVVWQNCRKLLRSLGKRNREPSDHELSLYRHWVADWGFTPQAIEEASRETLKGEPNLQYLNGILQRMRKDHGDGMDEKQVAADIADSEARRAPVRDLLNALQLGDIKVSEGLVREYEELRDMYPPEIILLAAEVCCRGGRKGDLEDVHDLLAAWQTRGLRTTDEVQAFVKQVNAQNAFIRQLNRLWEIRGNVKKGDRSLLEKWRDEWGFSDDMIVGCAALADGADKPMAYLNGILRECRQQNITTPEEAVVRHREWKTDADRRRSEKRGKVVSEQQYTQREYEENSDLPDWMKKRWKEMTGGA